MRTALVLVLALCSPVGLVGQDGTGSSSAVESRVLPTDAGNLVLVQEMDVEAPVAEVWRAVQSLMRSTFQHRPNLHWQHLDDDLDRRLWDGVVRNMENDVRAPGWRRWTAWAWESRGSTYHEEFQQLFGDLLEGLDGDDATMLGGPESGAYGPDDLLLGLPPVRRSV